MSSSLLGGLGTGPMFGGAGADVFVFQGATAESTDATRGYSIKDDSIGLLDGAFGNASSVNIGSRLTIRATGTVAAPARAQLIFGNGGTGFGRPILMPMAMAQGLPSCAPWLA